MRLIFKEKFFKVIESCDIIDENDNVIYRIIGKPGFGLGRNFLIKDFSDNIVGEVKQKLFSPFLELSIYEGGRYVGKIKQKFAFFSSRLDMNFKGWTAEGDWLSLDYYIKDKDRKTAAKFSRKLNEITDTFTIDVYDEKDILSVIMVVFAVYSLKRRFKLMIYNKL